jgi:hypothetical protein
MFLTLLIIVSLILSVSINTFIKGMVYANVSEHEETDEREETQSGLFLTALGVVLISNMIPFTLGAIIGLYAIL